jgi:Outer membrane protein beta-barrel domain
MIRTLASALLFLALTSPSFAQHLGLKVGYNHANVILSPEPMNFVTAKSGFHVGLVLPQIDLTEKVGLRPELQYSLQGFDVGSVGKASFHYVALPVLANLQVTPELSLQLGPQVSYLADARLGIGSDLFSISYNKAFHRIDLSGAAGMEYKVSDKMSIGGRYVLGFSNVNKDFDLGQNTSFNDFFELRNTNAQVYITFGF